PLLAQDRGMDAARQLAQLLDRLLEAFDRSREHLLYFRAGVREPLLRDPEIERDRDEPLLRTVVEVPLDPEPLRVGRGNDALPGLAPLRGLRLGLGVQRGVPEGEPRRSADRVEELLPIANRRVVDERRHRLSVLVELRDAAPRIVARQLEGL